MREYRVFVLDSSGQIVGRHDIHCVDELEAFKRAHDYCAQNDIEVWQGDRPLYLLAKGAKLPQFLSDRR